MPEAINPERTADEFKRLLDAQTAVYRQILALSEKQQAMVEERRENELLVLLSEKQRLIDNHQKMADSAKSVRERWERDRDAASPAAHAKVETAWNALKSVLDQIVRLEDASREVLQEQHGKVSMDIGKIQRGRIANKAYGGGMKPPPAARFSDRQG